MKQCGLPFLLYFASEKMPATAAGNWTTPQPFIPKAHHCFIDVKAFTRNVYGFCIGDNKASMKLHIYMVWLRSPIKRRYFLEKGEEEKKSWTANMGPALMHVSALMWSYSDLEIGYDLFFDGMELREGLIIYNLYQNVYFCPLFYFSIFIPFTSFINCPFPGMKEGFP